jgi:hypothetical protein
VLAALAGNTALVDLRPGAGAELVRCDVAGEELRLPGGLAAQLEGLQAFAAEEIPATEPVWVVNQPTLYSVLGRVAPSWWLYFYWAESEEEQRAHIRALEERGVDWVLVRTAALEGPEERDFASTHPLVWAHLRQAFRPVHLPALPRATLLLRRHS